jgi:hypothetical protein
MPDIELSPLALAVWLCDDGNVMPVHSPWRLHMKLSTHGFQLDNVEFIRDKLVGKFHENFCIAKDEGHHYIQCADNATRAFLNYIDDFLPVAMLRKACWRNSEARFYENQPERTGLGRSKGPCMNCKKSSVLTRGLCNRCYDRLAYSIRTNKLSWGQAEDRKLCLPFY